MVYFSVIIYRLTSPHGKRYIGQTTGSITKRWGEHRSHALRSVRSKLYACLRKHEPILWTVEEVASAESQAMLNWLETVWIAAEGDLNIAIGGDGGPMAQSTKDKISKAHMGKNLTQETKDKLRAALTGKKLTQETRDKISAIHKGRKRGPMSQEHKDRISKAMTGKERTQSHKDRISKANMGKKHTQATKDKMSAATKGVPWSAARRAAYEAGSG